MCDWRPVLIAAAMLASLPAAADDGWSGELRGDYRYFPKPSSQTQTQSDITALIDSFYSQLAAQGVNTATLPSSSSVAAAIISTTPAQHQPGATLNLAYQKTLDGDSRFTFKGFARYDGMDPERTHADIRELMWTSKLQDGSDKPWDIRVGVGKVFWGTAESNHLVDIVNSTDAVENIDGSEKLGQPMVRLSKGTRWGTWDFLLLPYFRPPTASGPEGRLRPPTAMTEVPVRYNRALDELFPSWVARWSQRFSKADVGAYYFQGTNRDVRISSDPTVITDSNPLGLIANYDWIRQWGVDANYLLGDFTFKGEYMSRFTPVDHFQAVVGGFEYTFSGLFGSDMDLNVVVERSVDTRGQNSIALLQNDNFYGLRLAFNDVQSTQIKVGLMHDRGDGSKSIRVEATRRWSDSVNLRLEGQFFRSVAQGNPLFIIQDDSYLQLSAIFFF